MTIKCYGASLSFACDQTPLTAHSTAWGEAARRVIASVCQSPGSYDFVDTARASRTLARFAQAMRRTRTTTPIRILGGSPY
jgi:hypothetical protein